MFDYNHAPSTWTVLVLSLAFADDATVDAAVSPRSTSPPGSWASPTSGVAPGRGGFDCWGWARPPTGRPAWTLPRVAQDQFDAGPRGHRGPGGARGLLFFGGGADRVDHVGIYVGDG